ncbi:MAG: hypothetical protein ACTSPY_12830 [Candidatus Helarchaeota archaeon]
MTSNGDEIAVIFIFFIILGSVITVITLISAQYSVVMTGDTSYLTNAYWTIGIVWAVLIGIIILIIIAISKSG